MSALEELGICGKTNLIPLYFFIKEKKDFPKPGDFQKEVGHLISCPRCKEIMAAILEHYGLGNLIIDFLCYRQRNGGADDRIPHAEPCSA